MDREQAVRNRIRKEFIGTVTSDKMSKTIVVEVTSLVRHGQYSKTIKRKAKFKAHDEKNEAHLGDRVRIEETRPLSKDKRWRLIEVISRAKITEAGHDL
jgi:small subunit ribosomal protein S17